MIIGTVQVESIKQFNTYVSSDSSSWSKSDDSFRDTVEENDKQEKFRHSTKDVFFLDQDKTRRECETMLQTKRDMRTTIVSSTTTHVENLRKFFFPMMITITIFFIKYVYEGVSTSREGVGKIPNKRQMSGQRSSMTKIDRTILKSMMR